MTTGTSKASAAQPVVRPERHRGGAYEASEAGRSRVSGPQRAGHTGQVSTVSWIRLPRCGGGPAAQARCDGGDLSDGNRLTSHGEDCRIPQEVHLERHRVIAFGRWREVERRGRRVPIDAVTAEPINFIPGLAVDPATSGSGQHLALAFTTPRRHLQTPGRVPDGRRYISSPDGARTGRRVELTKRSMSLDDIRADNLQGPMTGDYHST